jgi:hypothetical protein
VVPHRLLLLLFSTADDTLIYINGHTHDNDSLYFGIRSVLTRDFYIRIIYTHE